MKFEKELIQAKFIRRYKRFLVDVELGDGTVATAHTSNTGSMKSCLEPGAEVFLSESNNHDRKTRYNFEMIKINESWIGINTIVPNILVHEALINNAIVDLSGFDFIKKEVNYGNSRLDFKACNKLDTCYIEVKNVTLKEREFALFPDAVSKRGAKHLGTLMGIKSKGMRAIMVYVIQRMDVTKFAPAAETDPFYSKKLAEAILSGVEVIPVQAKVSPSEIRLERILPVFIEGEVVPNTFKIHSFNS